MKASERQVVDLTLKDLQLNNSVQHSRMKIILLVILWRKIFKVLIIQLILQMVIIRVEVTVAII